MGRSYTTSRLIHDLVWSSPNFYGSLLTLGIDAQYTFSRLAIAPPAGSAIGKAE
jgi:hypothetical protein